MLSYSSPRPPVRAWPFYASLDRCIGKIGASTCNFDHQKKPCARSGNSKFECARNVTVGRLLSQNFFFMQPAAFSSHLSYICSMFPASLHFYNCIVPGIALAVSSGGWDVGGVLLSSLLQDRVITWDRARGVRGVSPDRYSPSASQSLRALLCPFPPVCLVSPVSDAIMSMVSFSVPKY